MPVMKRVYRRRKKVYRPRRVRRTPRSRRVHRRNYAGALTRNFGQPVPDRTFTKLRWAYMYSTGTIGTFPAFSYLKYSMDLADLDTNTGSAQQPLWRDQLATFYQRYRIYGIKYTFALMTTSTRLVRAGVRGTDSTQTETSMEGLMERRGTYLTYVPPSGSPPKVIRGYISNYKPFGLTKQQFKNDTRFECSTGLGSPSLAAQIWLGLSGMEGASVDVAVTLDVYVEYFDRTTVALS